MRTMVAPGVWRDDGPSRALTHNATGYVVRPVLTVGSMVPFRLDFPATSPARREQMAAQKRRARAK